MVVDSLVRLYDRIPPAAREKARFWASRATVREIHESVNYPPNMQPLNWYNELTVVLSDTGLQLFGIPIMIDDRMPLGKINVEVEYGTAEISGQGRE